MQFKGRHLTAFGGGKHALTRHRSFFPNANSELTLLLPAHPTENRRFSRPPGLVELLITPWAAVTPEKGCPTRASIQNVELNVRFFPFRDVKRGLPSSGRQALRVWRASSPRPNPFDMPRLPNISKYCVCAAPQHLGH